MHLFSIETAVCVERIKQAQRRLEAIHKGEVSSTMRCLEEFDIEINYLIALREELF
jgi:hypothetical protein